jgi:Fe2+ or Zn2+ uptake regulation protein
LQSLLFSSDSGYGGRVRTPTQLTEAFRQQGLKVTPQRQCIFRILHDNDRHPTADLVYAEAVAEMPTISLRTVYQTLNDLAEMGEIQSLDLGTGSARFDSNIDGHHHLVCEQCGKVRDVYVDADAVHLSRRQFQGYRVTSTEIVFRGQCDDCSTV